MLLDFCHCFSPLPAPGVFSLIFSFSFPIRKFSLMPPVPSSLLGQFQLGTLPLSSLDLPCQYHSCGPIAFSIALGPLAMYVSWLSYVNSHMDVPLNYNLLADFILRCIHTYTCWMTLMYLFFFITVKYSYLCLCAVCSLVSDSLRPHGL